MVYKVVYTRVAENDLEKLPKRTAIRIVKNISQYARHRTPLNFARKLKGFRMNTYRFRIGEYRAIFRLDPKTKQLVLLVILKVVLRKDAY
jgi:mRNA interferase RelE/StbE